MRIRHIPIFVLVVSFAAVLAPSARATCGSASCFCVTDSSEGAPQAHMFRVDLSFRTMDQDRKRAGTGSTSEVLTPKIDFEAGVIVPDHHREESTRSGVTQLDVAYGITNRIAVLGSAPLWQDKRHQHFDDVGTPEETFVPDAGSRGFGDVRVGARYALVVKPQDLLFGTAALKLPTGAYQERDQEGAINEPGIQPGTGSYDGIVSLGYSRSTQSMKVEGFLDTAYRANGTNSLEYRVGNEWQLSGGARFRVGERGETSVQVNVSEAGRDRFLGMGVPSTGRTYVYLTPGGRIRSGDGVGFYAYVQLPVYTKVNEAQLGPRMGLIVGVSKAF